MEINAFKVGKVQEKIVAIVCFGPLDNTTGIKPGAFYQVTIDPKQISPSGEFIRFGGSQGDEIMGWQRAELLTIVEVLGKWEGEDPPQLRYGTANGVTMLLGDQVSV